MIYTAFCQEKGGSGTIWISQVEAPDTDKAVDAAIASCAADWEYDPEDVHCLGIAAGNVNIVFWEDQGDD